MFNRRLDSFLPSVYKGIVEMEDIMSSEESLMNLARTEMAAAFANTFVLTSDESGVIMFERMLEITANIQTEDLEFRRQRVLNRLAMSPPFTFTFLKQKLDEIIGKDRWTSYVDFENHTLYVESSAVDQNWYSEVEFTIDRIKPCNMVFVNVPRTANAVALSEQISYVEYVWKYRLGSWRLGQSPFSEANGGGIIKMDQVRSVQNALLTDTANYVAGDIASVLINDSIKITEFRVKQASENVVSVEYSVTPEMTSIVTNIKLLKADNSVLTQSSVYVPVTQPIVSKHIITVKEGV